MCKSCAAAAAAADDDDHGACYSNKFNKMLSYRRETALQGAL